jgi:hypothetical protein
MQRLREAVGCKIDVSNEMSWGSGKDMDCAEGEAESMICRCHLFRRLFGLGCPQRLSDTV